MIEFFPPPDPEGSISDVILHNDQAITRLRLCVETAPSLDEPLAFPAYVLAGALLHRMYEISILARAAPTDQGLSDLYSATHTAFQETMSNHEPMAVIELPGADLRALIGISAEGS